MYVFVTMFVSVREKLRKTKGLAIIAVAAIPIKTLAINALNPKTCLLGALADSCSKWNYPCCYTGNLSGGVSGSSDA